MQDYMSRLCIMIFEELVAQRLLGIAESGLCFRRFNVEQATARLGYRLGFLRVSSTVR